jgi:hypothetical protein
MEKPLRFIEDILENLLVEKKSAGHFAGTPHTGFFQ